MIVSTSYCNNKLTIRSHSEFVVFDNSEILCLQADGSYTEIITITKSTILVSKPLNYFEKILPSHIFFRCHNSFIINLILTEKVNNVNPKNEKDEKTNRINSNTLYLHVGYK